ncbi:MAG: pyrroline-5-carboxylate reductase [Gammaproteobacteria bacterium]|nr:pyrroline-5-carboxylate reductase [Gammaproteobacteria bacterium]MDH5260121.1 pyrroline-5-carboxylate reductase [Gammaproteobacteria bacterium]MDH5582262.1 pyrroline-5-carboxylate reductase [Gammaproteobacteria bacterium]
MQQDSIAFVGGGNMTRAIVGGLLEGGHPAERISIAEPSASQREILDSAFPGVFVTAGNDEAVSRGASVILAVKPQVIASVCRELAVAVRNSRPLIISIAAGPRIADIDNWLGGGNAVVRVMPNQPALLRKGISGIYANRATTPEQLVTAKEIMSAVGAVVTVHSEQDIDAVTAISGSGPAYFFLLIDMLAETGANLGLNADAARQLAIETACGAATLAQSSDCTMNELIARVRSPGGTTAAALDSLEASGIRDIFARALTAARDRAIVLADNAHTSGQD